MSGIILTEHYETLPDTTFLRNGERMVMVVPNGCGNRTNYYVRTGSEKWGWACGEKQAERFLREGSCEVYT